MGSVIIKIIYKRSLYINYIGPTILIYLTFKQYKVLYIHYQYFRQLAENILTLIPPITSYEFIGGLAIILGYRRYCYNLRL